MLALLAIGLQIVGAFGHVHAHGGFRLAADAVLAKGTISDIARAVDTAEAALHKAKLPSPPDSDAICAVCLAGHLIASAVTASQPALVLPVAYVLLGPPHAVALAPAAGEANAFWSRGPPVT